MLGVWPLTARSRDCQVCAKQAEHGTALTAEDKKGAEADNKEDAQNDHGLWCLGALGALVCLLEIPLAVLVLERVRDAVCT